VANRLSENPDVTVLVLEAGGEDPDDAIFTTPMLAAGAICRDTDWGYFTEPQTHACFAMNEKVERNAEQKGYSHTVSYTCCLRDREVCDCYWVYRSNIKANVIIHNNMLVHSLRAPSETITFPPGSTVLKRHISPVSKQLRINTMVGKAF
jgi:hypothetical protein